MLEITWTIELIVEENLQFFDLLNGYISSKFSPLLHFLDKNL